ncbi:hypothetical protein CANMA_000144 [Candida margitis]|uniref:uncharacterized protein n=1 Tax=Candida margitis TaxID=1775924 RepID=UPI00222788AF|nr:uncharacterized protein CANMA_000144 [Candida margitis]KAI5970725.1 hypothetical protein CANMA_000144 [Candida margitis]
MSYYYTAQPYANPVDLDSLLSLLHQQQFRPQQPQQQPPQPPSRVLQTYPHHYNPAQQQPKPINSRPRVVQKLETEDEYQIQIYKPYGNFNNYEVKVKKLTPPLIKVIIFSHQDDFQIDFNFNLNYIDLENINWRWYKQDNILSLNIPKKLHYIHSNLNDVINCLLGGSSDPQRQLYLEHDSPEFEDEEQELEHGNGDDYDDYDDYELGDSDDSSLDEHERLVQEAIDALIEKKKNKKQSKKKKNNQEVEKADGETKQHQQQQLQQEEAKQEAFEKQRQLAQDAIDAVIEKKKKKAEEEEKKAQEEARAKAEEEAKKKAEEEAKAKKEAELAAEARRKAAEIEAQRKVQLEKTRKEFALKQEQERQKILQAQQELEKLVKEQEELERQHKSQQEEDNNSIKSKESQLKSEILNEEDEYNQNSNDYEQYLRQQQDLLDQFFGFNLGPVLTSNLPSQATDDGTSTSNTTKKTNSAKPNDFAGAARAKKSEPTKKKQVDSGSKPSKVEASSSRSDEANQLHHY